MTSRLKALLAGVLLTCTQAHAGVLYSWHNASDEAHSLPKGMVLQIEFSDAAVALGSIDYVIDSCGWGTFCDPDPEAPVMRFMFDGVTPPISYAPSSKPMDPFAMLTVSVRFQPNGFLSGFISANDTESSLTLGSGDGKLWTVDSVRSDSPYGGACDLWSDECRGATGFMRAEITQEVPEPGTMALFGASLLGLLIARRRRR